MFCGSPVCHLASLGMSDSPGKATLDRLKTDQPIEQRAEDDLGRLPLVDLLTDEVRHAPTTDGFVMALAGPWGEGKTSVLNLVADAVESDVVVVRFNPWLFTDANALVVRFFSELSAQIGRHQRLRNAGKKLAAYGKAVAPLGSLVVGPAAELVGKALGALDTGDGRAVDDEREELRKELRTQKQRILVLIDDIDRLHDEEIIDVMRLVKLVGDLPFVTYLLAFDRPYVEKAVDREQWDGRSYLEKVVQVSFNLPTIRKSKIELLLLERVESVLADIQHLPLRQERWEEVLGRGMMPFFRNLRDVVRYSSSIRSSVMLVGKDVAVEDVLGLEALRVFEPRIHQELPKLLSALTQQRPGLFVDAEEEEKKEKALLEESLSQLSLERRARVEDLLTVLFPMAGDALGGTSYRSEGWRVNRQVADASVLRTYLHASIDPDTASYIIVEETLQALGDRSALQGVLEKITPEVLSDLLSQLPGFRDRVDPSTVKVGVLEFLKLESRLPDEEDPLPSLSRFYLKRTIGTLLNAIPEAGEQASTLRQIFNDVPTESERLNLIYWFGTFPDRERKQPELEILDEGLTRQLQEELNQRVRAKGIDAVRDEPKFTRLITEAFSGDESYRRQLANGLDDSTLLLLLHSFVAFSINANKTIFDLGRAEQLFTRDFLLDRIARMDGDALTGADQDMLALLQTALDHPAGG